MLKKAGWRIVEVIVRLGFLVFSPYRVSGKENVPRDGALIVVCNHLQMADIPLLGAALPRKLTFVGKRELWDNPVLGALASWYEAFPIDKSAVDTRALRQCLRVLEQCGALVIFPEGTRSLKACLLPGQPGAALIALRSGAVVLPVAITGTERSGNMRWLWRRPHPRVNIGRPFKLPRREGESHKEQVARGTDVIMRSIAALLPEDYRGAYASPPRAEPH